MQNRDFLLDELGDPNAPIGSRLWSLWVANEIRKAVYDKQQTDHKLKQLVEAFKDRQGYQAIGFLTWEDFCQRKLQKQADEVDKALTPVQQKAMEAEPVARQGRPEQNKLDNCQVLSAENMGGGNSAEYLTARIARDRPDVLDDMKAGKYRSVRAAAIDAGIVKPVKRFSLPDTPEAAGKYLAERVDEEWIKAMLDSYYRHIS